MTRDLTRELDLPPREAFCEGSPERLEALHESGADLTADQRRARDSHLLGGLACYVDNETWDSLVRRSTAFATAPR